MIRAQGTEIFILNETLEGRCFDDRKVDKFTAVESTLRECQFVRLHIRNGCFGGGTNMSTYDNCTFDRCSFRFPTPGRARFVNCRFIGVRFTGLIFRNAEFIDCRLDGTIQRTVFDAALYEREIAELGRARNEYRNNDFRDCRFKDVGFRGGIQLDPGLLPTEPGGIYVPDSVPALEATLLELDRRVDGRVAALARSMVEIALDDARCGQHQHYLSPADLTSRQADEAAAYEAVRHALLSQPGVIQI